MYDNEEEIKRKRRNLLIIIGVVVLLIILLLIFLFTRGSGKKKTPEPAKKNLECKLEVKNGIKPNANGVYSEKVEVGFASVQKVSDKAEHEVSFERIGKTENDAYKKAKKNQTYKIQASGEFHLTGYVEDKSGNSGTCEIVVKVNISNPECELEVINGKLGNNDFYTSNVDVGFKSMSSNSDTTSIVKYYIEKEAIDLETNKVLRADPPKDNIEKYTVTENQTTSLIGYVIDSNGNEGSCSITVKKDSEKPSCKLKVVSGTLSNGVYKDEPTVGFEETTDSVSDVAAKGVGISKNYSQETFTVTANGTTKVYGYVKDNAGNENVCAIDIKRPTPSTPKPPTPPSPSKTSRPTCTIKLAGTSTGGNTYIGQVQAILSSSTTNGASVTQYGIAESQTLNGQAKINITNAGSHTVYGMTKDSYGNVGYCSLSFTIKNGRLLSSVAKPGQYVNYDAGVWTTTSTTEKKQDGFTWGYTSGQSKNNSGSKCFDQDYVNGIQPQNGWIVLSVNNGKVVLVHAGVPECMYHDKSSASAFISKLNTRANEYLNRNYAESASVLSCNSPGMNGCQGTSVDKTNYKFHATGRHYYLATAKQDGMTMWGVRASGTLAGTTLRSYGVRPVVVLKSTVLTTSGNGTQSSPWVISNN